MRRHITSVKTVTFDPSPPITLDSNTNLKSNKKRLQFQNGDEWQQYFNALLADLENSLQTSGIGGSNSNNHTYGAINKRGAAPRHSPTDPEITGKNFVDYYSKSPSGYGRRSPTGSPQPQKRSFSPSSAGSPLPPPSVSNNKAFNNNLSELDSLLQDLSNSRYVSSPENGFNGSGYSGSGGHSPILSSRTSSTHSTLNRTTIDNVLSELNAGDVNYTGPKKVTITVKETKTESGYPGESELVSQHVSATLTPMCASSATKELDSLMASLTDNQVEQQQQQQHYYQATTTTTSQSDHHLYALPTKVLQQQQQRPVQTLDSMLGSLQADMSRQGVNTSQKGCCSACDKPIVGQVITALGRTWHPEHFNCAHCKQELGTRNFFERDGKPYCEADYHKLFSPRCAYCNGPIMDKCVTALEKTWHMEHFFCAQCGKQFGDEGFHERDGKPYCRDDYFDMFAPKCGGCNRAIMENYISALNAQWHPDCFVCRDCKKPVQGKSFYTIEGSPVCPACVEADDDDNAD